ncbi:hypothetical protein [Pseudomonas sp. JY-Q]|uniref:hypothetical protein n=1 Tax=Pseudomonas sp. JY-Q TaxID=1338689 RepID=UPI0012EB03CF|nr:hypothetical protein [Pseudomonas sp. JY-Q]
MVLIIATLLGLSFLFGKTNTEEIKKATNILAADKAQAELTNLAKSKATEISAKLKSSLQVAKDLAVTNSLLGKKNPSGDPLATLSRDAPINLSCSRGKLQFSRHLQRHWTKSDRKIMYGELFRPVLRVKREPHPYP